VPTATAGSGSSVDREQLGSVMRVESVPNVISELFANASNKLKPQADIVHERFHAGNYMNEGFDKHHLQKSFLLSKEAGRMLVVMNFS